MERTSSVINISNLPAPVVKYAVGLWRRRWTVLAVAWVTALLIWFFVWTLPDQYQSRAQVFVQTETVLDSMTDGNKAQGSYERRVEVMTLQLLTRPNVEQIIYRAGLDKEIDASSELDRRAKLEQMIDWVAGEIKIRSPQELYFVITYEFGDPEIARNVVDAVLNLLIEQDLGASLTENEEARRRLNEQIESFDKRLTAKEQEVAEFRRVNAAELSIVEGSARQRDQYEGNLSRVADEMALVRRRVITLEGLLATTPRVSSGKELDDLLVELAQLRSQYQENYPDIINLKARISQLQTSSSNALPDNPEFLRIRNELRAAKDLEASLGDREERLIVELEKLSLMAGQAPAVSAELQRIIRDYDQTQKNYEELIQSRDRLSLTAKLGAGGRGVEYEVFERPMISFTPVSPPRMILIIGGLIMSLGVGAAAALGLTFLDKSFSQASELSNAYGLPVLGALSESSSVEIKRARILDLKKLGVLTAALLVVCGAYLYVEVFRVSSGHPAGGSQNAIVDPDAAPELRDVS